MLQFSLQPILTNLNVSHLRLIKFGFGGFWNFRSPCSTKMAQVSSVLLIWYHLITCVYCILPYATSSRKQSSSGNKGCESAKKQWRSFWVIPWYPWKSMKKYGIGHHVPCVILIIFVEVLCTYFWLFLHGCFQMDQIILSHPPMWQSLSAHQKLSDSLDENILPSFQSKSTRNVLERSWKHIIETPSHCCMTFSSREPEMMFLSFCRFRLHPSIQTNL